MLHETFQGFAVFGVTQVTHEVFELVHHLIAPLVAGVATAPISAAHTVTAVAASGAVASASAGTYILALSGHVVTVVDGDWYDTWDSGGEIPIYYWVRED